MQRSIIPRLVCPRMARLMKVQLSVRSSYLLVKSLKMYFLYLYIQHARSQCDQVRTVIVLSLRSSSVVAIKVRDSATLRSMNWSSLSEQLPQNGEESYTFRALNNYTHCHSTGSISCTRESGSTQRNQARNVWKAEPDIRIG